MSFPAIPIPQQRWSDSVQQAVLALLQRSYALTVDSQIDLNHLPQPCIFAANHASHLDSLTILAALPFAQRQHTRIAAAADYWYSSSIHRRAAAMFNTFPFPRSGAAGIKRSLALLQQGWSILLYPAGTRSASAHFRPGIGLLAASSGCPVIPTAILGSDTIWPKGKLLPRRGKLAVRFGAAVSADRSASIAGITQRIEAAVKALMLE
jgi:1-acyl-sn-glycerol-3-phosphate acyltransferase